MPDSSPSPAPSAPTRGVAAEPAPSAPLYPEQPFFHLDALWIQVAGSRCNLRCTHCFVSCGPEAGTHALMSRAEVAAHVAEALEIGAREFYFTGGEPFLHPEMEEILADTLAVGPATVLTNGTLFTDRRVAALAALSAGSRYALELRVSLDGASPREHDRFRGAGTFERTLDGLRRLTRAGLLPIVTATRVTDEDPRVFHERFVGLLAGAGIPRPRLKTLPLFRLGREVERTRGYVPLESLAGVGTRDFDPHVLQCGTSRAVTSRGAFVCPLLVDEPSARMGERVGDTLRPFELRHGACSTCYATGMTCANG
jgi:uncharacterized Fe-S cluster-containing radical SAM superfamily protein